MNSKKVKDMTGLRFERLLVVSRGPNDGNGNARWHCKCDCGAETLSSGFTLRNGQAKSCGCLTGQQVAERNHRHGEHGSSEYWSWASMLQRCTNPKAARYPRYGGRGITVCEQWRDFSVFLRDMGKKPSPKHSIERVDNDGNYEPGNCVWATNVAQSSNKSNNHYVVYRGEKMSLVQAMRAAGATGTLGGILGRLRRGWSIEEALETPPNPRVWANRQRARKAE